MKSGRGLGAQVSKEESDRRLGEDEHRNERPVCVLGGEILLVGSLCC